MFKNHAKFSLCISCLLLLCQYGLSLDYLGCYHEGDRGRILSGPSNLEFLDITLERCQMFCLLNSNDVFFGAEYYQQCFCGSTITKSAQPNDNNCDTYCKGNESQSCGGTNYISIYSVCPKGHFGNNCSQECHCLPTSNNYQGYCNRDGNCKDGCLTGWQGVNCATDIDECQTNKDGCDQNCTNTVGSYYCSCGTGFLLEDDKRKCREVDECQTNNGGCNQTCKNTVGSYICSCMTGFHLEDDNHQCEDDNECLLNNGGCEQICNNTIGSYNCRCREGFKLDANQRNCTDDDECSVDNGGCQHNCTNSLASFSCSCRTGYQLDNNLKNCTVDSLIHPTENSNWKWIVIGVLSGFGLILLILLLFFLYRRYVTSKNEDSKAKTPRNPLKVVSTFITNSRKVLSRGRHSAYTKDTDDDVTIVQSDDVTNIYVNVGQQTGISSSMIEVKDLPEFIKGLKSNSVNLEKEFKGIAEKSTESYKFAEQNHLKEKNKYKNILPYDFNRVKLTKIGGNLNSTYINASFIEGPSTRIKYIASHGPVPKTVDDFWRMVWENNVTVIIMLTNCTENGKKKCEEYWPKDKTSKVKCNNDLSVKLSSAKESIDHIIRKLLLSLNDESRQITQIQYTAWPDHRVPPYSIPLLMIRNNMRELSAAQSNNGPVLVHCSAGVGRSGTFIALDDLLEEAKEKKEFDICRTVTSLRNQRMNSVQTLDQYKFIHRALYEGLVFGETRIPFKEFRNKIGSLHTLHPVSGKTVVETEFNLLQEMQPPCSVEECSEALSPNFISKNRDRKVIPSNHERVNFRMESKKQERYINAVAIPNHEISKAYISTQLPMENTLEDFWLMCLENKCQTLIVLIRDGENDLHEDLSRLIPEVGQRVSYGRISVQSLEEPRALQGGGPGWSLTVYDLNVKDEEKKPADNKNTTALYANNENPPALYENTKDCKNEGDIKLYLATFPVNDDVRADVILNVHNNVMSQCSTNQTQGPIVVISRNGVDLCGPYLVTTKCLSLVQCDDVVDVVQSVIDLKKSQPLFISNIDEYELLYKTLVQYTGQTALYENCRNS